MASADSRRKPVLAGLRVLVVDDEKNIRRTLTLCLEDIGCEVVGAASAEIALAAVAQRPFDIAFVDLKIGESSGLDLLPKLLAENPDLAPVVLTAYATFDTAVEAIKRGAADYLPKPFSPDQIRHLVAKLAERIATRGRLAELDQQLRLAVPETILDTNSTKMQGTLDVISRAADSDVAVLLRGESGTGKGVLARALHARSRRRAKPFVVVNCPTLSENLLTSELFGHARGASPARSAISRAGSKLPRAARCSSTKSRRSHRACRRSCCGFCRRSSSNGSARRARGTPMSAWRRPPIAISRST